MVCFVILVQYCSGKKGQAKIIDVFLVYLFLEFTPPAAKLEILILE